MSKRIESEKPLVSVIIPCYNGEKFIGEAIESVINQTYQHWELIIVDDGSTDNSEKATNQYLSDKRIHYIQHSKNRGIPTARNTGIEASKGEYLAFLDQDDLWFPEKLEVQLRVFLRDSTKEVGLVFSDILISREEDESVQTALWNVPKNLNSTSRKRARKVLFLNNFIPTITVLMRRKCLDVVGFFDESLMGGSDDYDMWLRISKVFRLVHLSISFAIRREHKSNYSSVEGFFQDGLVILEKAVREDPQLSSLANRRLANLYYGSGRYYQQNGDQRKAREHLWTAVRYNSFRLKCLLALSLTYFGYAGEIALKGWVTLKSWRKK